MLHILVKDIRGLRWQILAVVAITLAGGYYLYAAPFLIGLAQIFLVVRVIQVDALVGDRQFWVTRPIPWRALLAAKTIFIAVFTAVPTFFAHWAVLAHQQLHPASHLGGLLWILAGDAIGWLPIVALAAVTRNLAQLLIVLLVTLPLQFVPVLFIDPSFNWQSLDWARDSVVVPLSLIFALAAVLWQYSQRRAWPARGLLASMLVALAMVYAASPWDDAIGLVYHSASQYGVPSIQIAFDAEPPLPASGGESAHGMRSIYIPLRIMGLPEGTEVAFDAAKVDIRSENGATWRGGWSPWVFPARPEPGATAGPDRIALGLSVSPAFLKRAGFGRVDMKVALAATVFQNDRTIDMTVQPNAKLEIPGIGVCTYNDKTLHCLSALRLPSERLGIRAEPNSLCAYPVQQPDRIERYRFLDVRSEYSVSPFPFESHGPDGPVRMYQIYLARTYFEPCPGTQLHIVIQRPIAHIRQELTINSMRLRGDISPEFTN